MKIGWTIHCSTGCSCCREDNYNQGIFLEKKDAEEFMKTFHTGLASQFSKYGEKSLQEIRFDFGKLDGGERILFISGREAIIIEQDFNLVDFQFDDR